MRIMKIIRFTILGAKEAEKKGMYDEKNWTPLYVYLHTTRLSLGILLGLISGCYFGWMLRILYSILK